MSPSEHVRRRSAATLADVAARAGVSISAVSRALNHPGRITPETTARIQAAARELNFSFNPAARALLTGKTATIGLVLADITNPVVFGVIRGAERAAAAAGHTLIIAESQESGEPEASAARSLLRSVDGLVLAMSWLDDESIRALAQEKPLALINRVVDGVGGVVPDVRPGIRQLLDHLQERGHSALAYVAGPDESWMNGQRRAALRDEARARGITIHEVPSDAPTIASGREALDGVLASSATAVMAYNDLLAIGLLQAAKARGVRVPDDLAVTGFDAIYGSELVTPALTTVATPLGDIAARAVEVLLGVDASDAPLTTHLVVRESS